MRAVPFVLATGLVACMALSASAAGEPPRIGRTIDATFQNVEVAGPAVPLSIVRFEVRRSVRWVDTEDTLVYGGPGESTLTATVRARDPELIGALVLASAEDPLLERPPLVALAFRAFRFQGVIEAVRTRCDANGCDAEVTLRESRRTPRLALEQAVRAPDF